MPRYTVAQNYRSGLGTFEAGQEVELPEDFAAHINRDAPGTLEPVVPEPEATGQRTLDAPPADRMVKSPQRKRGGA